MLTGDRRATPVEGERPNSAHDDPTLFTDLWIGWVAGLVILGIVFVLRFHDETRWGIGVDRALAACSAWCLVGVLLATSHGRRSSR